MKGKHPLFEIKESKQSLYFKLNLQLFAEKRVSDLGISLQNAVSNKKLKNLIGELYREGALVGDGSAMAAASLQVKTGQLTGGKDHIQKINERIANLKNILKNQYLNNKDKKYAEKLLEDMNKSLKGEY